MIRVPTSVRLFPLGGVLWPAIGSLRRGAKRLNYDRGNGAVPDMRHGPLSFLEGRPHEPPRGSTPDLSVLNCSERRTGWWPNRYRMVAHGEFDVFP